MKKSCKYCGGIHEPGFECPKKPRSLGTKKRYAASEDIFRGSNPWRLKREQIKKRDGYLCQACLHRLPGTLRRINPYDLSVHHIVPLRENMELGLCDENLVTLCRYHHERAESGELSADELRAVVGYPPRG